MTPKKGPRKMLGSLSLLTGLALVAVVAASTMRSGFAAKEIVILAFSSAFTVIGVLAFVINPKLTLAFFSSVLTLLAGFLVKSELFVQPARRMLLRLDNVLAIHSTDERYGYRQIPGATTTQETVDFHATYHIDGTGNRATLSPRSPIGRVVVVGGSFTFGQGVADDEAFPGVLGKRYWRRYKVANRGTQGWGTPQAYLAVEDEMAGRELPALVLYGWLDEHVHRCHLNRQYVEGVSPGRVPRFERVGDRLVLEGYVGMKNRQRYATSSEKRQIDLSMQLIREMHRRCAERRVPFVALLLPGPQPYVDQDLMSGLLSFLKRNRVPHLDLRHLCKGQFFPVDRHPDRHCHAALAKAVADAPGIRSILKEQ